MIRFGYKIALVTLVMSCAALVGLANGAQARVVAYLGQDGGQNRNWWATDGSGYSFDYLRPVYDKTTVQWDPSFSNIRAANFIVIPGNDAIEIGCGINGRALRFTGPGLFRANADGGCSYHNYNYNWGGNDYYWITEGQAWWVDGDPIVQYPGSLDFIWSWTPYTGTLSLSADHVSFNRSVKVTNNWFVWPNDLITNNVTGTETYTERMTPVISEGRMVSTVCYETPTQITSDIYPGSGVAIRMPVMSPFVGDGDFWGSTGNSVTLTNGNNVYTFSNLNASGFSGTDRTVSFTIPGNAIVGDYVATLSKPIQNGVYSSGGTCNLAKKVTIKPFPAAIAAISPTSAYPEKSVTITGISLPAAGNTIRFTNTSDVSKVYSVSGVTSNGVTMVFSLPSNIAKGSYNVTAIPAAGTISGTLTFSVPGSVLASVSPTSGYVGSSYTLTGNGFTSTGNTVWLVDGSTIVNVTSQTAANGTNINFTVPSSTSRGTYSVFVVPANGATSTETVSLQLKKPTISTISPNMGRAGTGATITGKDFYTSGGNTVTFTSTSNQTVKFTASGLPTDGSTINLTVPSLITAGTYGVNVKVPDGPESNVVTFTVPADNPPQNVQATIDSNKVRLSWVNDAPSAVGIKVYRRGITSPSPGSTGDVLATLSPTDSSYVDLLAGTLPAWNVYGIGGKDLYYALTTVLPGGEETGMSNTVSVEPCIMRTINISAYPGDMVTLNGSQFYPSNSISFSGPITSTISGVASDGNTISFALPVSLVPGSYSVSVANCVSNDGTKMTVNARPTGSISSLVPSATAPGYAVKIAGTNFPPSQNSVILTGPVTKMFLNLNSNGTTLDFNLPINIPAGHYVVSVYSPLVQITGTTAIDVQPLSLHHAENEAGEWSIFHVGGTMTIVGSGYAPNGNMVTLHVGEDSTTITNIISNNAASTENGTKITVQLPSSVKEGSLYRVKVVTPVNATYYGLGTLIVVGSNPVLNSAIFSSDTGLLTTSWSYDSDSAEYSLNLFGIPGVAKLADFDFSKSKSRTTDLLDLLFDFYPNANLGVMNIEQVPSSLTVKLRPEYGIKDPFDDYSNAITFGVDRCIKIAKQKSSSSSRKIVLLRQASSGMSDKVLYQKAIELASSSAFISAVPGQYYIDFVPNSTKTGLGSSCAGASEYRYVDIVPTLASVSPNPAYVGSTLVLVGTNLSSASNTVALVGSNGTMVYSNLAATGGVTISFEIPTTTEKGTYSVNVFSSNATASTSAVSLTLKKPKIDSVSPTIGRAGDSIVINGSDFDTSAGNTVVFASSTDPKTKILRTGNTSDGKTMTVTVPSDVIRGTYKLSVRVPAGVESNVIDFSVRPDSAPQDVKATISNNVVKLTWTNDAPNATDISVYRHLRVIEIGDSFHIATLEPTATFFLDDLNTIESTSFIPAGGRGQVQYDLRATLPSGVQTETSNRVTVYACIVSLPSDIPEILYGGDRVTMKGNNIYPVNTLTIFGPMTRVLTGVQSDGESMVFDIPNDLGPGEYSVSAKNCLTGTWMSSRNTFTVAKRPSGKIISVFPKMLSPGEILTIVGSNFPSRGNKINLFGPVGRNVFDATSTGDTIEFALPNDISPGDYNLSILSSATTIDGFGSFKVMEPRVTDVRDTDGDIVESALRGTAVTISGTGFSTADNTVIFRNKVDQTKSYSVMVATTSSSGFNKFLNVVIPDMPMDEYEVIVKTKGGVSATGPTDILLLGRAPIMESAVKNSVTGILELIWIYFGMLNGVEKQNTKLAFSGFQGNSSYVYRFNEVDRPIASLSMDFESWIFSDDVAVDWRPSKVNIKVQPVFNQKVKVPYYSNEISIDLSNQCVALTSKPSNEKLVYLRRKSSNMTDRQLYQQVMKIARTLTTIGSTQHFVDFKPSDNTSGIDSSCPGATKYQYVDTIPTVLGVMNWDTMMTSMPPSDKSLYAGENVYVYGNDFSDGPDNTVQFTPATTTASGAYEVIKGGLLKTYTGLTARTSNVYATPKTMRIEVPLDKLMGGKYFVDVVSGGGVSNRMYSSSPEKADIGTINNKTIDINNEKCMKAIGDGPINIVFMATDKVPMNGAQMMVYVKAIYSALSATSPFADNKLIDKFSFWVDTVAIDQTTMRYMRSQTNDGIFYFSDPERFVKPNCREPSYLVLFMNERLVHDAYASGNKIHLNTKFIGNNTRAALELLGSVFVHEFGHALAGLNDEYTAEGEVQDQLDWDFIYRDENCTAFPEVSYVASDGQYQRMFGGYSLTSPSGTLLGHSYVGCHSQNSKQIILDYLRPSNNSMMNTESTSGDGSMFNVVSCGYIMAAMEAHKGDMVVAKKYFSYCNKLPGINKDGVAPLNDVKATILPPN